VRNRIARLLSNGVVRMTAIVDPAKVGFPMQVVIGINVDLARMERIENQLAAFEEVTHVSTLTGRLDFLIFAAFPSSADLRKFLVGKLSKIEGIRRTETFHVLNLAKRMWHWKVQERTGSHKRRRSRNWSSSGH